MPTIDEFDRRILSLMTENSRRTGDQLSEAVGLSPAACLRRLDRLRKNGVIEREVAVLSKDIRSCASTQIIVLLTITRHSPKELAFLTERLRSLEEVDRVFSVTGQEDLVVILSCRSVEAFSTFAETYFSEPPVEGYQSLVVLREFPKAA